MKKRYKIKVKLKSPLLISAGVNSLNQRVTLKEQGVPYIPGTLLKGMVRQNFEALMDEKESHDPQNCKCANCEIFGASGFKQSRLIIDNLFPENLTNKLLLRANNAFDRYLKVVKNHALVFSEVVPEKDENGVETVFSGEMTIYYTQKLEQYEKQIIAAFHLIKTLGNGKSRGLGFVEIEVSENEA